MTPEAVTTAARLLADLRLGRGRDIDRRQLEDLPLACRPGSIEQAYRIQDEMRAMLAADGLGAAVGWKIGCTTSVMQTYLEIPHPCAGTLYRETVGHEPATLDTNAFFQLGLECELAVRVGETVPARRKGYERVTIAPYVETIMTSVEVVDHRFRDFGAVAAPSLIADDFFSFGCITGDEIAIGSVHNVAALQGGFCIDGAPPEQTGRGAEILGHPLVALAWLANHLLARGTSLQRGELVTLGSVVKTVYPTRSTTVQAVFDTLAPVTVHVA
jgi:2-keto-4-pentenoate hydratase